MTSRKIADSVLELIGNTPMVRLRRLTDSSMATILAKLESCNPGGSVKDRICLGMIEDAEARGALKPGSTIVEPTSGNTGIGLAMIGAVKGYRVILTMPETMSAERIYILKRFGAQVILTPADQGMLGAVRKAEEIAKQTPGAFLPQQFRNPSNPQVHRQTTAQEILRATDGAFDAFVAGVGTGGTITGVGEVLKKKRPAVTIIAVEPQGSPVLSGGAPGPHMIQGIGAGFVPEVLNREIIDEILPVSDEQAYDASRRLATEEGIFVGVSAGAACWAALQVAKRLGRGKTVVTVFPDTGERYISIQPFFESSR
ncbi:MAG TPA: cysteine synthase A [Candidatus Omnitrophica bacterium]|nr:MAG: cysteine synthase A [Omnitrophica WOR_2 bacterium GWA2_63_20]OGX17707.1 MAG: cysteine synthase A [Omnitrophica WOR_2 bacterium GWF2_63_9]OGX32373.1 MAG: cysteine synthase A [Omnitrophica WOR_2 bacterium RIFCSPHIGHO2_12_FULL_64_13]OGX36200.1 MAG: cysteine synthase A [Omnitrophica WOR_2 bacterium RIFCSPHIGHO2_02_FULL_63_39]OGX45609.1 MAG: cysteine synthase A [Omnitrophica WOR_2 bacterium RIFCSPLOWO2_02_FULL_63_16]OGX48492.1 MAG: cysteine synthase A [Omnitrophica WOR_2 bacterium RIFCSPLOW